MTKLPSPRKSLAVSTTEKQKALIAARKAQTLLAKVVAMLEDDHYCIDVLQQALAVQGLWKGVIRNVFANHLHGCFGQTLATGDRQAQEKMVAEIVRVMGLAERT